MLTRSTKNGLLKRIVENVKAVPAYLKEKYIYSANDKRTSDLMTHHQLGEGIMGANNFNTAYRKIKSSFDAGDMIGANSYAKDQAEKIRKQKTGLKY